ncbi:MAG: ABC transporter ATP-binding protein [Myxococcales bacterium]|nr:ABC transporter ATP-binding protein [Myxococcales bacterium]
MSTDSDLIVEVDELRKTYTQDGKDLEVLKGVTLRIEKGEMLSIVGKSGAGKSTLLHLIGTLDQPSSGRLKLNGKQTLGMTGAELALLRNELIGFVFQFHHLLPEFTAIENVMMPGVIRGLPRSALEATAKELLERVNLGHRATHRPSEMSGGEQQRVALARALSMRPKLLLADEPTGNLDTENSAHMNELFTKLNRDLGTTMVIVTHNERLADQMPRVITMKDGKVEKDERKRPAIYRADEEALARDAARADAAAKAPVIEPSIDEPEKPSEASEEQP